MTAYCWKESKICKYLRCRSLSQHGGNGGIISETRLSLELKKKKKCFSFFNHKSHACLLLKTSETEIWKPTSGSSAYPPTYLTFSLLLFLPHPALIYPLSSPPPYKHVCAFSIPFQKTHPEGLNLLWHVCLRDKSWIKSGMTFYKIPDWFSSEVWRSWETKGSYPTWRWPIRSRF